MIEYFISLCYTFDLALYTRCLFCTLSYLTPLSYLSEVKRERGGGGGEIVTRYDIQSYDFGQHKNLPDLM